MLLHNWVMRDTRSIYNRRESSFSVHTTSLLCFTSTSRAIITHLPCNSLLFFLDLPLWHPPSLLQLHRPILSNAESKSEELLSPDFKFTEDHPLILARRNASLEARSTPNYVQNYKPGGTVNFQHSGSQFSVNFNTKQDFVVGIGWSKGGTFTSDGATCTIWEHQQVNQPSIQGTSTFDQYISVHSGGTASGTVSINNHFNAWKSKGMNLGT